VITNLLHQALKASSKIDTDIDSFLWSEFSILYLSIHLCAFPVCLSDKEIFYGDKGIRNPWIEYHAFRITNNQTPKKSQSRNTIAVANQSIEMKQVDAKHDQNGHVAAQATELSDFYREGQALVGQKLKVRNLPGRHHGHESERIECLSGEKRACIDADVCPTASKLSKVPDGARFARMKLLHEIEKRGLERSLAREQAFNKALSSKIKALSEKTNEVVLGTKNFSVDKDDIGAIVDILHLEKTVAVNSNDKNRRVNKLDLSGYEFCCLPDSIKRLSCLSHLNLRDSKILSLPSSIGQLQNLEEIDLSRTSLEQLPEEIGDLSSLKKLNLCNSSMKSIPPSIGKLQNLEEIDLSRTSLEQLPEEIGDLASLKKLNLCDSRMKSIPRSIGKLQNLEEIDLSHLYYLKQLPEGIRRLSSLTKINLLGFAVTNAIKRSKKQDFILYLLEDLPLLGSISIDVLPPFPFRFKLACNRARILTGFDKRGRAFRKSIPPKLWPLLLYKAKNASKKKCKSDYVLKKRDAIYHLLQIGRDSFISLIINHITEDHSTI
jgi:hypothetical protein